MTDTERLDWLARQEVYLFSDGSRWAVATDHDPLGPGELDGGDLAFEVVVYADQWKPTIREAIDEAIRLDEDEGDDEADEHDS